MKRPNLASRNHRSRLSFAASASAARAGAVWAARVESEAAPERTRRENITTEFRILFIRLPLQSGSSSLRWPTLELKGQIQPIPRRIMGTELKKNSRTLFTTETREYTEMHGEP